MGKYFHLADYVLWSGIVLYALVLWKAVRWRIALQLWSFHFYLLFCLLRTVVLLLVAHAGTPLTYWQTYALLQIIGFMLQARMCFKLIDIAANDTKWIVWGALLGMAGVLAMGVALLGTGGWIPWLRAIQWCDTAMASVLVLGLVNFKWQWPYKGIALGLVMGIVLHLGCGLVQHGNPLPWLRALYQISSLVCVGIWWWTVRRPIHRRLAFSLAR